MTVFGPEPAKQRTDIFLAFFFFSCCEIFDLRRPIAAKFCTVIGSVLSFEIRVIFLGGGSPSPKKIGGQKHAKFGAISDESSTFDGKYLRNI